MEVLINYALVEVIADDALIDRVGYSHGAVESRPSTTCAELMRVHDAL